MLNLLISEGESLTKGPGRRAQNLITGLTRLGVPFEICGDNYEYAVAMQGGPLNQRVHLLPEYTPIGPNVMHNSGDDTVVAGKFKNYIVQAAWVEDYWKWQYPEQTKDFKFYIQPPAVDLQDGFSDIARDRNPGAGTCLLYTKYQNEDNRICAEILCRSLKHSFDIVKYGEYDLDGLKKACLEHEYCIFNSCCEKGSNALMEILGCGIPVYVIDSKRWIGDDKFDRCTSAPYFDDRCGVIGDREGTNFNEFYENVRSKKYNPHDFIAESYTVEKTAQVMVEIIARCHP